MNIFVLLLTFCVEVCVKFAIVFEILLATVAVPKKIVFTIGGKVIRRFTSQGVSTTASFDPDRNVVTVGKGEKHFTFPSVWLRDNCRCSKCYSESSKNRLLLMKDLQLDIVPTGVFMENNKVVLTWPDGHESRFDPAWLEEVAFTPDNMDKFKAKALRAKPKLWGGDHKIEQFSFEDVMKSDEKCLEWLKHLDSFGISLIRDMPEQSLESLCDRIGFTRRSHYGSLFEVEAKSNASNAAYTNASLGLHTDLPYYYYEPGVQLLHCLKQTNTSGGENNLTDGFYVAEIIRKSFPVDWKILSQVNIAFTDVASDVEGQFHKVTMKPVIQLGSKEEVKSVSFNNQTRSTFMPVPMEMANQVYGALKRFNELAYDSKIVIEHKLEAGQCLVFDNRRVLHGRKGYEMGENSHRHLQGAYVDWDEVKSVINLLAEKNNSDGKRNLIKKWN